MRSCADRRPPRGLGLLLLLLGGCTLPGGWYLGPKPADKCLPDPATPFNLAPPPGPIPAAHSLYEAGIDQISVLKQQLAGLEDERRVLFQQVQELENRLFEREQTLQMAVKEADAAKGEIEGCRKEMRRWQKEVADLRSRVRAAEKEDRKTLEAMVHTLEQLWERQRAPEADKQEPELPPLP